MLNKQPQFSPSATAAYNETFVLMVTIVHIGSSGRHYQIREPLPEGLVVPVSTISAQPPKGQTTILYNHSHGGNAESFRGRAIDLHDQNQADTSIRF
jgi:hypothetical protein